MGCWCDGTREMNVNSAGLKRLVMTNCPRRANELIDTLPAPNLDDKLSRIYRPEWLDLEYGEEMGGEREQTELMLSRFDEGLD
jgi:hypothetical protein